MEGNRPRFGDTCVGCFRCVYGCPSRAMRSSNFMVLKKGFSLERLETRLAEIERGPDPEAALGNYARFARGFFKALKKYLDRGYAAMRGGTAE
jgi:ferredoxin